LKNREEAWNKILHLAKENSQVKIDFFHLLTLYYTN